MRRVLVSAAASAMLAGALVSPASEVQRYLGTVNHVLGPDTIRISYQGGQIRVKLADSQTHYPSDGALSRLVGTTVEIEPLRWEDGYLIGRIAAPAAHKN